VSLLVTRDVDEARASVAAGCFVSLIAVKPEVAL